LCHAPVAGLSIKAARPSVRRLRRRLDIEIAAAASGDRSLDELEQRPAHTPPLRRGRHDNPVEVEGPARQRYRPPRRIAEELALPFRELEPVAAPRSTREALLEQLERDGTLLAMEHRAGRRDEPSQR